MSQPNITPATGLTRPAHPDSGQKSQFALFTDSWLQLQGYVGSALELPISNGSFESKYGSFGGATVIQDCVGAMRNVQQAATEFGNPQTLRTQLIANPKLLASDTPPDEVYTHTVWMGQRVHRTAQTLASGYKSVVDGLSGLPAKDQVTNLKAYLFDQTMGPIPLSKQMSDEVGVLITKLGKFEQKMNEYNEKMQRFTRDSSSMMAEVNGKIGDLQKKIQELEGLRDEAYKAWRDFTIAAVTASVGCALIGGLLAPFTGGASLLVGGVAAVATGVGLGVKAAQCRAKYNAYCDEIGTQSADLKKKQRLRSDLGDFNMQMQRIGPAMQDFMKNLQTVQGVWTQMNSDMVAIGGSLTESNVGTLPFLVKAKANAAVDSWKEVGNSAKQFTVESLVDYTSIAFGDKLPEAA